MNRTFVLTLAALLVLGGSSISLAETPLLMGDTNEDYVVDIIDLNNVRNHFGTPGMGDTNDDEMVDIIDLNNVRNNFGASIVPEPSSMILALFGTGALGFCSRRRRRS